MNISDKNILVIGGAGLIGSHVVEALLEEPVRRVSIFENFTRGTESNIGAALGDDRVRVIEGDITHLDVLDAALAQADGVFHLAALWLLHCHEFQRAAFDVNIKGTFNVLEGCVKNGIEKLVYSSSASVYGNALEVPMTEEHPYNNRTFYGATKIAGEHMARAMNERYGLDYVGLRYMNVYGPRQDYNSAYTSVIMKVLDRIDEGKPPLVYGDGSQSYDFIHVTDVARANVLAMTADATDEFYNVGAGTRTTIQELVELLLELTDPNLGIQYEPAGQTFVTHRVGSTEKARADLGFQATVDLREGLKTVIEWRNRQNDTATYDL
jgi:UDP-glucose 4-epimerase